MKKHQFDGVSYQGLHCEVSESKSLILTLVIFSKWGFTVIIRDLEGTP